MISRLEILRRMAKLERTHTPESARQLLNLLDKPEMPREMRSRVYELIFEWAWGPEGFDDPGGVPPPPVD